MGPAHGRFAFEGEPWMSLFEKNIYVGRIIASKRALGSVVRCKRRPLSCAADFFVLVEISRKMQGGLH